MLIRGISIKARIGATMAFLAALLLVVGLLGLVGMSQTNDALRDTATVQMPSATALSNAEIFATRARLALDRATLVMGSSEADTIVGRSHGFISQSDKWWSTFLAMPRSTQEDHLASVITAKRTAYKAAVKEYESAITNSNRIALAETAGHMQTAYSALSAADGELNKYLINEANSGYTKAQATFGLLRIVTIAALVAGLVAAFGSYLVLRRAIGTPLKEALGHFDAITSGDLRRAIVVRTRDEMGQLMQGIAKMQQGLIKTVSSVRSGSESIATATREIAAGNIDLSSRTEEQASVLQETASSMDELTNTVKQNADNARQASTLAANASEIAGKGNAVVNQVVDTMGDINKSSAKIAEFITIIEGITFQTNILALNAAVEAARAGEQGRGFAVVASEVRNLAQRSADAAKEIKTLIETSVERVQTGSALVDQAGRTMGEIIAAVSRVTDIMGEIAAASQKQSHGIEHVAKAVIQMDEVTQQNAALVEQAAAAAQSLEDQAAGLRDAVSIFRFEASAAGITSGDGQGARPRLALTM
ncbi:methyl-accepting chemotaxis protein [Bordetella sp. FB-8]|uniref:methyl-accepting chemotaxis protein n=1 Tax=Bordetella sp. FB-8 TaxID=1159870 RepID=UPI00035DCBE8|nr:methyl-accepting chemotaxis protein [Bordetella sp. FB-8]